MIAAPIIRDLLDTLHLAIRLTGWGRMDVLGVVGVVGGRGKTI